MSAADPISHRLRRLANPHQTRPPSSIAPQSSSDADVPIVGAFGGVDRGQHGHPDWSAAMQHPYATNCNALCILTPLHQNQHQLLQQFEQQKLSCWTRPHGPTIAPPVHQWPSHRFTTVPSFTTFWWILTTADWEIPVCSGRYLSKVVLQFYSFWNALTQLSSHRNLALVKQAPILYVCPFVLLPAHQLWGEQAHLLPNISHLLTGAMTKIKSVLFTFSPVRGHSVMPDVGVYTDRSDILGALSSPAVSAEMPSACVWCSYSAYGPCALTAGCFPFKVWRSSTGAPLCCVSSSSGGSSSSSRRRSGACRSIRLCCPGTSAHSLGPHSPLSTWSSYWGIRSARRWDSW